MIRAPRSALLTASVVACVAPDLSESEDVTKSSGPVIVDPIEKLDLADYGDPCPHDMPDMFDFIWIANTDEGTVSKIDIVSAVEVARYRTGPGDPDPSRTSVNLHGDVAVANRAGGVTKIVARSDDCVDRNGNGVIDTSQGPGDILAWWSDECVVWHHPIDFPQGLPNNRGGPRGLAWDGGSIEACRADESVWIGWRDQPRETVLIRKIDGASGEEQMTVPVFDWRCEWGHGPYGAAVDTQGAYWGLGTQMMLVRVDPVTRIADRFRGPWGRVIYGVAIDVRDDPWLSGWDGTLWRFDVDAEAFEEVGGFPGGPTRLRGLAIDRAGHAWIAGNEPCALVRYDTERRQVVDAAIELPGCGEPVGVSVDSREFVWVVDHGAHRAFRVDPESYETAIVEGLVGPYTYSDMTGHALANLMNPP